MTTRSLHEPCPSCGALPGQRCTTKYGAYADPHVVRLPAPETEPKPQKRDALAELREYPLSTRYRWLTPLFGPPLYAPLRKR